MKHYLSHFAVVYSIALLLLILILLFVFPFGAFSILPTLLITALISAIHFVKREKRLPVAEENIQLIWGLSAVAIVIGSFFIFFLVLMNPNAEQILKSADQAGLALSAVIMLLIVGIHAIIFSIAYRLFAKFYLQRITP